MKGKLMVIVIKVLIITTISSCSTEKASTPQQMLDRAKSLAEVDPQGALLVIDSLHECYPKEIRSRRIADTIEWQIEFNEAQKNVPVLDSMLRTDSIRLHELAKKFYYSKIDQYQDYGTYEHRRFQTENNTGRCYIKPTINDLGEILLISYYSGKKEEHTGFTVIADGYEKSVRESENVSGYSDGGTYREFITTNDSIENGIIGFVAGCEGDEITIRLLGEQEYEYTMGSNDIEAFRETVELAKLLQEMHIYNSQVTKFTKKIDLLGERLQQH